MFKSSVLTLLDSNHKIITKVRKKQGFEVGDFITLNCGTLYRIDDMVDASVVRSNNNIMYASVVVTEVDGRD